MQIVRVWSIAARPWALPASAMPVLLGTALACAHDGSACHVGRWMAALIGMACLHIGANMWSDVNDWRRGLDRERTPLSGALARGLLSERAVAWGAWVWLLLGALIGWWLVTQVGLALLWIGAIGVVVGVAYAPLKYIGLGDLAVFLNFGVLGTLGAWTVQTGRLAWAPVAVSIPLAMLVVGILHANNWRDMASDRRFRVRTPAGRLGDRGSQLYFAALIFAPFAILTGLVWASRWMVVDWVLPLPMLATWLALPMAWKLWRRACARDLDALDGGVAQLNLVFGLLAAGGAWAGRWWGA